LGVKVGGPSIPEKLTLAWIEMHSHIHLKGDGLRWTLTAWRNVVFLKINEDWTPDEINGYVDLLSDLPSILSEQWARIYFVFDLSQMGFPEEDAHLYLRTNWLELLDRENMRVGVVEESRMRRLMWISLYKGFAKLDRIQLFSGCDEAFEWVRDQLLREEP
jgi:hypothetical protein